jgi:prolyl-tRNA editing enzyme YbaK/EbsC (Cys-tRNA(Pro) deacylase)
MTPPLPPSAQKIQDLLVETGYGERVRELPDSTRSAAEAAAALGCEVARIGKSLIFRAKETGEPVMVVASGGNRVDEKKVAAAIGKKIGKADADFVRAATGFAIGGVPPIGHASSSIVLVDEDLFGFETLWVAAGTPRSVFEVTPAELVEMAGGTVADIKA